MMDLKNIVTKEIESRFGEFHAISQRIHSHPELAFQEVKATEWLTNYLVENGFTVDRKICELPTAFRGQYGTGGPAIAFLAEYDALPELGHGCGHNLIAICSLAAAIASKKVVDVQGGSIIVFGTPAEEKFGGKVQMVERGAFKETDIVMMVHPGTRNLATCNILALQDLNVEYFGRAAHAAGRPEQGINALEALLQSFAAINSLRQNTKDKTRINGIITDGGAAANIIPAHSSAYFFLRASDNLYFDELKEKVINCFMGAATATGARLAYEWGTMHYASFRNNLALAKIFSQNMSILKYDMIFSDPDYIFGSSDIGNVSQVVPCIHPIVGISLEDIPLHSTRFAEAAISEAGFKKMLDAAKACAMTVVDLLCDSELVSAVKKDFLNSKS